MIFDVEALEDTLVARLQEAVADGMIEWAGVVGDEAEVANATGIERLPGLAVLFRRAAFDAPMTIDVTRQTGIVEWSIFAAGKNLRQKGLRAGRRGATGAYHATMVATRYLVGFEIAEGFPVRLNTIDLASYDPRSERAMYELSIQHEWQLVEHPYGDE